jgi:phenylacetate-CoA ligase
MSSAFARTIAFPAHETLMRRPTMAILQWLAAHAGLSQAEISVYQQKQLAALIEHARATCPYWRQKRSGTTQSPAPPHLLTGEHASALATREAVPILTRAEIARHREGMRCENATGKLIHHSSSGTTDDNLVFYLDRRRQAWDRASRIHALARLGIELGEKQLHFMPEFGAGGTFGLLKDTARHVRDKVTRDPAFDVRPMTAARLAEGLALLDRFRPALIVGYPSVLFALAQHRMETGISQARATPRYVLCTGELLYDFQRRAIECAFGARVIEEYGSQEAGLIASEDASGNWLVNWPHVVVEVLRNGRPARAGEPGELVVTNLHSHSMPFIRYATGDVINAPAMPSDPEAFLHVLPRIEGRTSDVLVTTDGRVQSNRELVNLLVEETGVTEFSLHQSAPDRILCMTLRERGWIGHEDKVTGLLRSVLGRSLQVDWKIGLAFQPFKSGKRRYICSSVAQSMLAHDRESGMFLSRAWPQRVLQAA